jgi:hypothetical protein
MYKIENIHQKIKINYYILTPRDVFSVCFHCSLLGYRSQQWLHLYNVSTRRFLVTNLNYQISPASTANIFFYYYSEKINVYIKMAYAMPIRPPVR